MDVDHVLNQLQKAYNIRAKKGIVIQDECIRDGRNFICATMHEELMVSSPNLLTEKMPNSSFRTVVGNLSRIR